MLAYLYDEDPLCYHCIFYLHYDPTVRSTVDGGIVGKKIVDYIIECAPDHECDKCLRGSNSCFLCDFKQGIEIVNVIGADILYSAQLPYGSAKNLDERDITAEEYHIPITL